MGVPQDPRYQNHPHGAEQVSYQAWPSNNPYQRGLYPQPAPTNGTAIAALVFAFLFAPVGIILGHVARGQIKRSGEGGKGLATAALIIGYVFVVIPLLIFVVFFLIFGALIADNSHNDQQNVPIVSQTVTPPT